MKRLNILVCLTIAALNFFAQSKDQVYAGIIMHITKYVEWGSGEATVVKIGVVNNAKLVDALNQIVKEKNVNFKNVEVSKKSDVTNIDDIDILFLTKKSSSLCSKISTKAEEEKILVITEMKSASMICPAINFIEENGKLKFELYTKIAENCGLMVSEQLKKFAVLK